jgi:hypothetical protein
VRVTDGRTSVVHVGLPKTGSKWLQRVLFPRVTSHAVVPRAAVRALLIEPHTFDFDPRSARAALGVDAGPKILSEESLSGDPHTGGHRGALVRELARRLKATLPDARYLLVLRRQPEMIESSYREYVRQGGTHSIRRYLLHPEARKVLPLFAFEHFDYRGFTTLYWELFGKERVTVCLYEELAEDNVRFAARLATALGLDVSLEGLSTRRENEGMSSAGLTATRLLNRFTREHVGYKQYALHVPKMLALSRRVGALVSRVLPARRPLLDGELRAEIRVRYAESNAWLARETGLDLARHGYPV